MTGEYSSLNVKTTNDEEEAETAKYCDFCLQINLKNYPSQKRECALFGIPIPRRQMKNMVPLKLWQGTSKNGSIFNGN